MAPVLAAKVAELEAQLSDALEYRTLSVAGVWRDDKSPCGWTNRRAKTAETKVAELERELEDLNKKHSIAWSNWKTSGARIAELESFQINYHHATCMEREELQAKVAELESRVTELNDAIELRDQRINEHFAKISEQAATIADLAGQLEQEKIFSAEVCGLRDQQAAAIERLTELALTHPDFPTSCIHEEEPWYCDSCMLFYQEEMQHWHDKRDAILSQQEPK